MGRRTSGKVREAKAKGWWPESWVPVLVLGGPMDGHTIPYDPKARVPDLGFTYAEGRYDRVTRSGGEFWEWSQ